MDHKLRVIYTCFPGGKHKVLTFSYDDGKKEDRRLVEIFNRYGMKGTFNINGLLSQDERIPKEEWVSLYAGHEVACHTALHPTIARCPEEQVLQQVLEDRRALENVLHHPIRGLAYPNGSVNKRITEMLPYTGIRYGRTVHSTQSFAMPDDYMMWDPTAHHNHPELMKLGGQFIDLFKTQYLYMMYVWGHSYEFTLKDNWSVIENFCEMMSGHEDIWYATNIEICDYMDAASRFRNRYTIYVLTPSGEEEKDVRLRIESATFHRSTICEHQIRYRIHLLERSDVLFDTFKEKILMNNSFLGSAGRGTEPVIRHW